ncbi:uncharacterized protein LOC126480693 [Schistocerca serialis cubense]|uniref:uncharacterized protein LOC126480693 n=1 Tax=Schistocerca serialis cubense TaxID=2023355 RepID=UPI00214E3BEB|nr:uncharacterized protein LOC126480693 [Schistocerca serialis cubense]
MDLARSAPPQTGRTQQDDTAGSVRQDESQTGPFANVLFREIHKNALLRKLTVEKRMGAFPKKGERVWVVFCVHDDSEPLLEIYNCKNKAVTHKPDWFVSLSNCLHVSPTICPQEDEYEFVITLSSDVVRLTAPSWDLMMEWVECISSKLREMHILSPRENVYSKNPETGPRLPLAPTRDPNSPLPPPPAGPATAVPGIEQVASTGGESSSTEQSHDFPNSSASSSEDRTSSVQQLNYDDVTVQQRACTTSLYITQSEPPVYSRSRHVLCRTSSVPDSSSLNALAHSPVALRSPARDAHNSVTDTDDNVTVVRVNSDQVPLSAGYHPVAIFDFSTAATQMSVNQTECDNAAGPVEQNEVSDTSLRNLTDARQNLSDVQTEVVHSNNVAPDASDSSDSHYECVFLARTPAETATTLKSEDESPTLLVDSPLLASTLQDTVVPTDGYQRNGRFRAVSGSETQVLRSVLNPPAMEAANLHRASDSERQSTTYLPPRPTDRQDIVPATSPRADVVRRPGGYSTNQSERQETLAGSTSRVGGSGLTAGRLTERCETSLQGASLASQRAVITSTGRIPERSDHISASATRGANVERQLQPAPHPYHRQVSLESVTSGNSGVAVSRMTLREQQVFQLRREMAHPGGVRLQLRRKDCVGSVALVDIFGSVWIAGWKQREHPMLYNALHIGDQLLTVVGVPVQSATDANRLIRGAMGLYVELVIRRVPFGRVFAIHREADGQSLGVVQEGNTAEVRDVVANSPAARAGLAPRAPTCDGLSLTTWTLTEINGRPLNLFFKDGEVRDRLNAVGKEVSVLVQPSDFVRQLKKQLKAIRGYKDYIVQ